MVTVALAKAITAFSFANSAAKVAIDESAKTIVATVFHGTEVTALVATFTTTGSSVKVGSTVQASGSPANNFTSPVIYTVTAADGSTASYTVTVTVAPQGWWTVGEAGFSAIYPTDVSLAIDSTGTPYVAYSAYGYGYRATVMRYIGERWKTVGMAGFSAGQAYYTAFAIDTSGTPYVAYEDWTNSYGATVMRYAQGSWQTVGATGFTDFVYSVPLAIDPTNSPYVAFAGEGGRATVMRYMGGSWQTVGAAGFTAGTTFCISLAVDSTDTPYVAYCEYAGGYRANVMRFK